MHKPPNEIFPICLGADIEHAQHIQGVSHSNTAAVRLMLAAIGGAASTWQTNIQTDSGRRWPGPFCAYNDLSHIETCLPIVTSARQHVAYAQAATALVRRALSKLNDDRAERDLPPVQVHANNTDGRVSYGGHTNFLVAREFFDHLWRSIVPMQLASYKASSIIFTGQGLLTSNGQFLLSQRAPFFVRIASEATTHNRGMVNSRDEALSDDQRYARKHTIFFDTLLSEHGTFLKAGVGQLLFARMTWDPRPSDATLILDDPVASLQNWNRNPNSLERLVDGRRVSAVEHQKLIAEREIQPFLTGPAFDEAMVPNANEIFDSWTETLERISSNDLDWLAPRLDHVMKRQILERALSRNPSLEWSSPELRVVADQYCSLGEDSIHFALKNSGAIERIVTAEQVEHNIAAPPEETRDWTRGHLIRLAEAEPGRLDYADWDSLTFRLRANGPISQTLDISLDDPLRATRDEFPELADFETLDEALAFLIENAPPEMFTTRAANTHYGSSYNYSAGHSGNGGGYGGYSSYGGTQSNWSSYYGNQ
jgi:proteasome accessory factor A